MADQEVSIEESQEARRVVVCAALLYDNGVLIVGPRHFDQTMHNMIRMLNDGGLDITAGNKPKQGFVDQFGNFLTRKEAMVVAKRQGQIKYSCDSGCSDELFSENLY